MNDITKEWLLENGFQEDEGCFEGEIKTFHNGTVGVDLEEMKCYGGECIWCNGDYTEYMFEDLECTKENILTITKANQLLHKLTYCKLD